MTAPRAAVACLLSVLLAAATFGVLATGPARASGASTAAAACDNAPLEGRPTVKVLVVGDSLSNGFAGDHTWRYRFWQEQRARGVNIDFVGPYTTLMGWGSSSAANESYADPCFDQREHFAVGSKAMASTLRNTIQYCPPTGTWFNGTEITWVTTCFQPDVVLAFMGYNDLKPLAAQGLARTPEALLSTARSLVAQVRAAKPGTAVALTTVAGTSAPQVRVDPTAYNALLPGAASGMSTPGEPVGLIDITSRWKGRADTWDGYHPNANGEMHLAWDVAAGLADLGLVPDLGPLVPERPLGPRVPGTLYASECRASALRIGWTWPAGVDRQVLQQRDVTRGTAWSVIHDVAYSSSFEVTGLAAHRYQFRTRAARGTALAEATPGVPLYSSVLEADLTAPGRSPCQVPTTPGQTAPVVRGVRAVPGYHRADVTWTAVPGTTTYVVAWRRPADRSWQVRQTSGTSQRLSGLVAGQPYYVSVRAGAPVVGPPSAAVAVTPTGVVTLAPPRPTLTALAGRRVKVAWRPVTSATRYQLQYRVGAGAWRHLAWSTATRFSTRPLVRQRSYTFRVRPYHQLVAGTTSAGSRISVS